MKKEQDKERTKNKGVMSSINDKPDKRKNKEKTDKKKGIISELNDNPDRKE
jgi:hypothetical protein